MKTFLSILFATTVAALTAEPAKFAIPQPGRKFVFPRDHGSHPDFKIEWWYITGHLFAADGRRFGWQATFFRRAGEQGGTLYLGHIALLDVKTGRFLHQERLAREGWDAGATTESLHVHCGPWSLRMSDENTGRMQVAGSIRGEASFDLALTPGKPLVVFGENGVSRKGPAPSAASHYLTFPRLAASGTLLLGTERLSVTGEAWMDHEISSSQLDEGQVGWDWACIQLRDGREAMVYRMRRKDGTRDPFSTLALIDPAGAVSHTADFTLTPLATWRSPHTGAEYPSGLELTIPARHIRWRIEPLSRDQELQGRITGIAYWEGACRVLDEHGTEIGSAFVELTGYSGDLNSRLR
jgi:predicted secreted hydrolase